MDMGSISETAPRSAIKAALLSLLGPGVGQIYNGQWRKGLIFLVGEYPLAAVFIAGFSSFEGLFAGLAGLTLFLLAAVVDAAICARRRPAYLLRSFNRWWIYVGIIGLSLCATLVLDHMLGKVLYQTFKVPSESMEPTLLVGDRFMGRALKNDQVLERGDIVVFHPPGEKKKYFVKRVVALPGEVVTGADGHVLVNGDPGYGVSRKRFGPVCLGPGKYWVMGDNRGASFDSRFFGPVSRERIKYRALYLYWAVPAGPAPASRFGLRLD